MIDSIAVAKRGEALAITVRDHYKRFAGHVEMLLDHQGQMAASFQYQYSGEPFNVSELGLCFLMDRKCQEIRWRRRTEWDVYPDDHIGRPQGNATAQMDKQWGEVGLPPYLSRPRWGWHLDANRFGTRDFRATKYNIYESRLLAPDGSGIRADSDGTANVRCCLSSSGVQFSHAALVAACQACGGRPAVGKFFGAIGSCGFKALRRARSIKRRISAAEHRLRPLLLCSSYSRRPSTM